MSCRRDNAIIAIHPRIGCAGRIYSYTLAGGIKTIFVFHEYMFLNFASTSGAESLISGCSDQHAHRKNRTRPVMETYTSVDLGWEVQEPGSALRLANVSPDSLLLKSFPGFF